MLQGGIYGFELTGGTCTHAFPGLHDQCITTMLYLPQHGLMLSASMDPGISVSQDSGTGRVCDETLFEVCVPKHCCSRAE